MGYIRNDSIQFHCGFTVSPRQIEKAVGSTNDILDALPFTLFQKIDYKTTSSIVGAVLAAEIAEITDGIVNPIEKGHPDVVPAFAYHASEEQLRNFGQGLEIKCTIGNVKKNSGLITGESRVNKLEGITWQAHHREVGELLGSVWDFVKDVGRSDELQYPAITGVFYSKNLATSDWGSISGTTGRNTKVSGMRTSGKRKMGAGWVLLKRDKKYFRRYSKLLGFNAH